LVWATRGELVGNAAHGQHEVIGAGAGHHRVLGSVGADERGHRSEQPVALGLGNDGCQADLGNGSARRLRIKRGRVRTHRVTGPQRLAVVDHGRDIARGVLRSDGGNAPRPKVEAGYRGRRRRGRGAA